jgi:hypothetical protein
VNDGVKVGLDSGSWAGARGDERETCRQKQVGTLGNSINYAHSLEIPVISFEIYSEEWEVSIDFSTRHFNSVFKKFIYSPPYPGLVFF